MINLTSSEKLIFKKLANCTSVSEDEVFRKNLDFRMIKILKLYYKENTQNLDKNITTQFQNIGITEDKGKFIISTARRLGFEIF